MERVPYIVQRSRCFYASFGIWLAIYLPLSMLSDLPVLLFVVSILTFGGAGATFMFWQAEAGPVIQEARAGEGDFSPRSVWWWVCPVLNLWMPLRGIVQLWEKSGAQGEKWMLGVWWTLWIGSLISQNLSFRLVRACPPGLRLVRRLASKVPARRVPSAAECRYCPITSADCPERMDGEEVREGLTEDF